MAIGQQDVNVVFSFMLRPLQVGLASDRLNADIQSLMSGCTPGAATF